MPKRVASSIVVIIFLLAILSAATVYYRKTYFFSPLTFRQDSVINLPYKYYRNPLYIEFDFVKPGSNPYLPVWYRSVTTNRSEILQAIADLRRATPSSVHPNHRVLGNAGMSYIVLRQQVFPTPRPPSPILLTVQIYNPQHVMEIIQSNGQPPVVRNIPQSLLTILNQQESKSVPDK
ncbi:hypothetical protein SAMN04489725_11064 [Alicyclobacillus hesperidum]|uniref:Uncharacterized protein n=1 Tax=Alicyclobacillus hesperidum TaxID=89784 RepID=A0A1H2VBN6_9BACL|nr:hypothetical protein [Alicyclobacillus hesperidum]SDW65279.1 hypothetical protein SAMN04489725_11064 [Alicyclobacillus hesperidum]